MRRTRFALAWAFVFAVAAYDVYFAWQYRADFHDWEVNPLARWVACLGGVVAVFFLKALLIAYAAAVAAYCYRRRHWLTVPYTAFVSVVHAYLSAHYLLAHFQGY